MLTYGRKLLLLRCCWLRSLGGRLQLFDLERLHQLVHFSVRCIQIGVHIGTAGADFRAVALTVLELLVHLIAVTENLLVNHFDLFDRSQGFLILRIALLQFANSLLACAQVLPYGGHVFLGLWHWDGLLSLAVVVEASRVVPSMVVGTSTDPEVVDLAPGFGPGIPRRIRQSETGQA